ncbi:DMT family transporter [Candidatus Roizmanbacteria bacterium]|nr:DMT family transporter [Candidatus Roizmanbacteria bacterium]
MTWFYFSIGTALSFTALYLFSRTASVKSKNPRAMSLVFNFIGALMAIALFLLTGAYKNFSLPKGNEPYIFLLIAVLFFGLFERVRFYAAAALEASLLGIVNNFSLVVAVVIAFFLYREPFTTNKTFGFLLILVSLILVSLDRVKKINWRGIYLGLLANFLLGVAWALDKKGALFFKPEIYNVFVWTLPMVILYFPYIKFNDIKREIKISSWKIVLLSFFNVLGYYLQLKAFSFGEATRVIPVIQTSTLFTVLLGGFFMNERENLLRKILAAVIAVVGVYLLV